MLVSGATRTVEKYKGNPFLGRLLTPAGWHSVEGLATSGLPWAADNAAFSGFDEPRYTRMIDRIVGRAGCLFVTAPDVVADAKATLKLFRRWRPVLAGKGLPVAFVAQDGQERLRTPWDEIDALFLGGTTDWKLGEGAKALAEEARARGRWLHMGRVNTRKRIRVAHAWGCDSIDGSGFSRWSESKIPKGLRWINECESTKT